MTLKFFNENYFTNFTDTELIERFNKEVWNTWWTSSRAEFLSLLHEEFNKRWFDYSVIWDEKSLSFKNKIKLLNNKIVLEDNNFINENI